MKPGEVVEIVRAITYKPGWRVDIGYDNHGQIRERMYVQVSVTTEAEASMEASGPNKGVRAPWKGGKKYLSPFMCRQEIVGAVFGAIQDAELHEVSEWFRYRGAAIYNQHLDPDVLVTVARKASSFNVRENAMSMQENVNGS